MDLRQLAALVAVAEEGTFSAAADALHTVQSNVSTHVARLERELGVTLVDRAGGRLTEEGEAVVARARRVHAELEALVADVAAIRHDVQGHVALGVIGTTGRWLVPRLLPAIGERHPGVRTAVLEGNTTTLQPALEAGRIDLSLVTLPLDGPELETEPLFEEELVLVAPTWHPLSTRDRVALADLMDVGLLVTPPTTSIRRELDEAAARAGLVLRPKHELDGVRLLASLAFEGVGPAVVPASATPDWLAGDWRRIPVEDLEPRSVGLARRRRGLLSAPARAVREVLLEVVADDPPPGIHAQVRRGPLPPPVEAASVRQRRAVRRGAGNGGAGNGGAGNGGAGNGGAVRRVRGT